MNGKIMDVYVRTPKDNNDYILLGNRAHLWFFPMEDANAEIKNEWNKLQDLVQEYEHTKKRINLEIVIRKDSLIGMYITSLFDAKIENLDDYITFNKVINAMNIAIHEENPIAKNLVELFKKRVSGKRKVLEQQYGVEIIKYIQENNDFEFYVKKINGEYDPKHYLVYEDGELNYKKIVDDQKQKTINNKNNLL